VIKRELPHVLIIGVDPVGSILAGPGEIKPYKVEGIGYDFIPDVLELGLVDRWIKSNDKDSFLTARQLIRQEGLLVGGSSGSAVWAAMQVCEEMEPGTRVVVVCPDSIRNYLTKFADDSWMRRNGFVHSDWEVGTVGDIIRAMPPRQLHCIESGERVRRALDLLKEFGISQLPVLDEGALVGIVTEADILHHYVGGRVNDATSVAEIMERQVTTVGMHASSGDLPMIFGKGEVAIVVDEDRSVVSVITKMDLIDLLATGKS